MLFKYCARLHTSMALYLLCGRLEPRMALLEQVSYNYIRALVYLRIMSRIITIANPDVYSIHYAYGLNCDSSSSSGHLRVLTQFTVFKYCNSMALCPLCVRLELRLELLERVPLRVFLLAARLLHLIPHLLPALLPAPARTWAT